MASTAPVCTVQRRDAWQRAARRDRSDSRCRGCLGRLQELGHLVSPVDDVMVRPPCLCQVGATDSPGGGDVEVKCSTGKLARESLSPIRDLHRRSRPLKFGDVDRFPRPGRDRDNSGRYRVDSAIRCLAEGDVTLPALQMWGLRACSPSRKPELALVSFKTRRGFGST